MNREIVDIFRPTASGTIIDCTLGMGGHSLAILKQLPDVQILGIEIDDESLAIAKKKLDPFADRIEYHNINYIKLFQKIDLTSKKISGILVDPGISMFQLKHEDRGFSHNINAPLDMRKDQSSELTAYDVINGYSEKELSDIFKRYGDLQKAEKLAKKIIEHRLFKRVETTSQLKEICEKVLGYPVKGKSHPAAKVFQALRIQVNSELEGFADFIMQLPKYLIKGGKLALLTFHSIEDRIVKQRLNQLKSAGLVNIIKPYPMFPTEEEINENSASAPAKLRIAEVA